MTISLVKNLGFVKVLCVAVALATCGQSYGMHRNTKFPKGYAHTVTRTHSAASSAAVAGSEEGASMTGWEKTAAIMKAGWHNKGKIALIGALGLAGYGYLFMPFLTGIAVGAAIPLIGPGVLREVLPNGLQRIVGMKKQEPAIASIFEHALDMTAAQRTPRQTQHTTGGILSTLAGLAGLVGLGGQ